MLFHQAMVLLKVFSILFKVHWACCDTISPEGNELLPVWREIGMGFFLYEWRSHEYRKKNFLTNHEWLSRRDEIKIPHARRSRKWGIFILSQLLSHDVMSEEIYPSLFLSRPGVTFPYGEEHFTNPNLL